VGGGGGRRPEEERKDREERRVPVARFCTGMSPYVRATRDIKQHYGAAQRKVTSAGPATRYAVTREEKACHAHVICETMSFIYQQRHTPYCVLRAPAAQEVVQDHPPVSFQTCALQCEKGVSATYGDIQQRGWGTPAAPSLAAFAGVRHVGYDGSIARRAVRRHRRLKTPARRRKRHAGHSTEMLDHREYAATRSMTSRQPLPPGKWYVERTFYVPYFRLQRLSRAHKR